MWCNYALYSASIHFTEQKLPYVLWEAWHFALTGVLLVFTNSMPVNYGNNSLKATPMHIADYVKKHRPILMNMLAWIMGHEKPTHWVKVHYLSATNTTRKIAMTIHLSLTVNLLWLCSCSLCVSVNVCSMQVFSYKLLQNADFNLLSILGRSWLFYMG